MSSRALSPLVLLLLASSCHVHSGLVPTGMSPLVRLFLSYLRLSGVLLSCRLLPCLLMSCLLSSPLVFSTLVLSRRPLGTSGSEARKPRKTSRFSHTGSLSGPSWAPPGAPGPYRNVHGPSWAAPVSLWGRSGAGPGPLLTSLGLSWAPMGLSWASFGGSGAALGSQMRRFT